MHLRLVYADFHALALRTPGIDVVNNGYDSGMISLSFKRYQHPGHLIDFQL